MSAIRMILILGGMALAGCGGKDGDQRRPAGQSGEVVAGKRMDSMGMKVHEGMQGMSMMPMMRAHLDSMMQMSPEQMSRTMAEHERMMSHMMDRMGADMRGMNMGGDAAWNALSDSVRADLAELPALSGRELAQRMEAHASRVNRLLDSHDAMMK
jgi:hypothetical protein